MIIETLRLRLTRCRQAIANPRPVGVEGIWNAARCLIYARTSVLVALILYLGIIAHSNLFTSGAYPPLFDFSVFWSAASLTLQGHPEQAYDVHQLYLILKNEIHIPVGEGGYGWFYPPFFLLVLAPLARVTPFQGYLLFMGLTLSAYLFAIYRAGRALPSLWWGVFGFSGLWFNLVLGQNGFITAALGAAVLISLEHHPLRSGVFLGLLMLKPQLGLLLPMILLIKRAWLALFSAGITLAITFFLAWLLLGADSVNAWWHNIGLARVFLERGGSNYLLKIPSIYSFLTLLGSPPWLAYLGQGITALFVVMRLARLLHTNTDQRLRNAAAMLGSLLMSPYVFEYDLTWLIFPLIWLVDYGREQGWYTGERELLALVWLLPYVMTVVEPAISLQLAPLILLLLLLQVVRRARYISLPTNSISDGANFMSANAASNKRTSGLR